MCDFGLYGVTPDFLASIAAFPENGAWARNGPAAVIKLQQRAMMAKLLSLSVFLAVAVPTLAFSVLPLSPTRLLRRDGMVSRNVYQSCTSAVQPPEGR